jgi:hypothetical protein
VETLLKVTTEIGRLTSKENDSRGLQVNPGLVTAFAVVLGSVVGALGSVAGTWITQRHQDTRDLRAKQLVHRESLYSDFIAESARLLVDALEHSVGDPEKLIPTYALLGRIRLSSSKRVLDRAEHLVKLILNTYSEPNLTAEQIQVRAANGEDPLREFSDICRIELDSMHKQI